VSTPKSLELPDGVRPVTIESRRGAFAALEAQPTAGVCERRPALLIPGFTGSKEDFIPVLQPLASAGRRVVAIDMRGQYQSHGASQAAGYAPEELGADIAAIADAIASDEQGLHLVGHSLGGLVAREAALARATRIISLTLLSSGPGRITGQRAAMLRNLLALMTAADTTDDADPGLTAAGTADPDPTASDASEAEAADSHASDPNPTAADVTTAAGATGDAGDAYASDRRLRAAVVQIWEEHLAPQAKAEGAPEHVIAFLHERMMSTSPTGLMLMGRYLLTCPDRTAALAELGGPAILVVYGENDDAWRPAVQENMARRLSAQRVCIPGAGHSPAVEAPETTASTLTAFWRIAEDSERRRAAQPAPGSDQSRSDSAAPASASPSHGRRGSDAELPSGQRPR
jgi:pimeloyl-ACP methyl ester carboxylesterase